MKQLGTQSACQKETTMAKLNDAIKIDINTDRNTWVLQDTVGDLHIQVDNKLQEMVKRILKDEACTAKETWRSKYTDYVIYDHEPFCSDGFMYYVHVTGGISWQHKHFLGMIVKTMLEAHQHLENCYKHTITRKEPV